MNTSLFVCLLLLLLPAYSQTESTLWKDGRGHIEKALGLEEEKAGLPESKWIGRDQKSADKDINKLVEEALAVFEITRMTELRTEYADLEDRIAKRRGEIRKLREDMLSAPEDTSPLEFYRKNRERLREEIDAREQDIRELEDQQRDKVRELKNAFAQQGVTLTDDQVRFYLGMVSGQDVMALGAVFANVREFNGQLEQLMRDNAGDTEAARRYYGMHVVLIRILRRAHQLTLERIDDQYLVRLDELEEENNKLRTQTERMINFASVEEKPLLQASLRTQHTTGEAITLYRDHLRTIRDNVYEAEKEIQRRYEVALNAFRTIRISAMLVREMESALQDLNALRSMQLPELIPIQDDAIRGKFMDIGEQLRR